MPPRDTGIQAHRDEGRRLFGLDPAGYRAGRPDYPEAVYETLVKRCGLGPTARVLEIGPGTGLVTRHLLRQGAHVTAVEPGSLDVFLPVRGCRLGLSRCGDLEL